jgi:hypothetical protein
LPIDATYSVSFIATSRMLFWSLQHESVFRD